MAKNAGQTRLRILSASRHLFSSHGFPGTSLDDILTSAGITKGAFYHHFKTKEHVCEVLLDEAVADIQCLAGDINPDADPDEQIRLWARRMVSPDETGLRLNGRLVLRLTGDIHRFNAPLPDKINRFWSELHAALTVLMRQAPAFHPGCRTPQDAAAVLLTVFTGTLGMDQSSLPGMDLETLMETSLRMILQ